MAFKTLLFRSRMNLLLEDVLFLVALVTQLPRVFQQQFFLLRLMGIVTGDTFTALHGGMFKRILGDLLFKIFVAFETKLSAAGDEQFVGVGLMWIMAGNAFSISHRLVFDWRRRQTFFKVLMAVVTKFSVGFQQ